jgi:asparagine synthase (glutamine-hydrolysing)
MCGIVGILHRDKEKPIDSRLLDRMTDIMAHRGPNDRGTYVKGNIGLGQRRLSIIDVKSGHQPMLDPEKKRVIVYNGEVYNFQDLAAEMSEGEREKFQTHSDTEVVLKLARLDDLEWLERMNGMFSFAIWDEERRCLMLARDRLGVKPLYYVDLGSSFIFASEIKPLLLYPGVRREVNEGRIPEFIAFRSIVGEETLFKGIKQVPPGHAVILEPDGYEVKIGRFWHEGFNRSASASAVTNGSAQAHFLEIFRSAVKGRLVSEVPVGTYNSGGVDSSLVTAIVRGFKSEELHTFSVGFNEATHDERKYSDIVSKMYRTNHHAIIVSKEDYAKEIFKTTWHLEEPINHPHTVQILLLSKVAKEFVTVVLTGEGADEVFGGYPRYNIAKLHRVMRLMPAFAHKWVKSFLGILEGRRAEKLGENLSYDETEVLINNSRFVLTNELGVIYPQGIDLGHRRNLYENRYMRNGDLVQRLLYFDQRSYLPSLLARLDKMSMAASIEARVPFLDYRLVEWSYNLPTFQKIRRFTNKYIVKRAAEQYLPKEIIYRRKFGFDVPISDWLRSRKGLGQFLDLLRDRVSRERGYFDSKSLEKLIDEHLAGTKDHSEVLWSILTLEIWCRVFIEDSTGTSVNF